jgi:hypothetical protein
MLYKPTIELTIKRLQAFWNKEYFDRPPIRIRYPVPGMSDEQWPKAGFDPIELYPYWDNLCSKRAGFPDDEIPAYHLDMGPGYMGGVLGCSIKYEHGTTWSEHCLKDWSELDKLKKYPIKEGNPWIDKLIEAARYFAEKSINKCAVGLAMLTGPGDVMAALRGPTELCMDIYESIDDFRTLASIVTSAYISTAKIQLDTVLPFMGGYVDNYNIWTPGKSTYFANDFSNLISENQYKEFFFEYDCQAASIYEVPWIHVHSGGARLVPEFLKIPGLQGIQIVNDRPAGPKVIELLPIFKLIQKKHCLILRKYSQEELIQVLSDLSPEGLYVDTQAESEEDAWKMLEWWEKYFTGKTL